MSGGDLATPTADPRVRSTVTTTPAPTQTPQFQIPTPQPTADLAETAQAGDCPVTPFSDRKPEHPHFSDMTPNAPWYEHDGIWVAPDELYGGRWFTGSMFAVWFNEAGGSPEVTARSLSGAEGEFSSTFYDTMLTPDPVGAEIVFPAAGCWEITATAEDRSLVIVVNVLPLAERADIAEAVQRRAALIPYPPPSTCAVTPALGPEVAQFTFTGPQLEYWIADDRSDLEVHGQPDLLFEGVNTLSVFMPRLQEPTVSGFLIDDPAITLRAEGIRASNFRGEHYRVTTLFPFPGCWSLHVESGDDTLDALAFVYPASCNPVAAGQRTGDCSRPGN